MRNRTEPVSVALVAMGGTGGVVGLVAVGAAWWTIPVVLVFALIAMIVIGSL